MLPVSATYPDGIWDGLSGNRDRFDDVRDPNSEDFEKLRAEIIAMQTQLAALISAAGAITMTPLVEKGTDPETITISDLFTITTKDIIVAVGGSAVASVAVGYTIPAGSLVLGAAMNIESAITLATATKIGLGISGSLAKYGSITGGTKNNKSTVSVTPTALASTEVLSIYATDNSNAAAGTIQNGSMRVRLYIATVTALPDAA